MSKEKSKKNISGKKAPQRTLKEKRANKAAKRREKDRKSLSEINISLKTPAVKKVVKGKKK